MKEKKNIDRLFKEKFRDFEAQPDGKIWENIRTALQKTSQDTPLIPLWLKMAGAAALLGLIFWLGSLWVTPSSSPVTKSAPAGPAVPALHESTPPVSDSVYRGREEKHIQEAVYTKAQPESGKNKEKETAAGEKTRSPISEETKEMAAVVENEHPDNNLSTEPALKDTGTLAESTVFPPVETQTPDKNKDQLQKEEEVSVFDEIANAEEKNKEQQITSKNKEGRISVQPTFAPVYYSSIGGGSALDPGFADSKTKGKVTFSYGVDVSYAVSNRIKIRSGINKINMSYDTPDIVYLPSADMVGIKALSTDQNMPHSVVASAPKSKLYQSEARPNVSSSSAYTEGEFNQEMSYIEVPLEMVYNVLDQRFAIHLIGGVSALFLSDDAIHLSSALEHRNLGRAENINTTSFTTNIGVGFSYRLTRSLHVNLEPSFKYQLNGFKGETGNFKPYFIGLYSGMSFRF